VSRSPTDLRTALARTLRRVSRRAPQRTVCLQAGGVLSWDIARRGGGESPATARFDDFDAWCAANEGCDARLFVSGHLLHSLLIDPALTLVDEEAVRAYAGQQFAHYHGAPARQWPLAVWADGPQAGACALHALDLDALRASAARHGVRLRSVAPLWSAGLGSLTACVPAFADAGPRALALVEGTLVTWLVADARRVLALQQRFLDAPQVEALAALLGRLAAECGLMADLPVVVGWGLHEAEPRTESSTESVTESATELTSKLRAHVIGSLAGSGPAANWVLDTMRSDA
jgi:hypothetical protein